MGNLHPIKLVLTWDRGQYHVNVQPLDGFSQGFWMCFLAMCNRHNLDEMMDRLVCQPIQVMDHLWDFSGADLSVAARAIAEFIRNEVTLPTVLEIYQNKATADGMTAERVG